MIRLSEPYRRGVKLLLTFFKGESYSLPNAKYFALDGVIAMIIADNNPNSAQADFLILYRLRQRVDRD